MIGPDSKSYIFCKKSVFGPEKIIPRPFLTQIWSGLEMRPPHLLSGVLRLGEGERSVQK
jgi:hypothetical protein